MISPLTLAHSAYAYAHVDEQPAVSTHVETEMSMEDVGDAATILFMMMMKAQQSHDRCASKGVDATSALKAEQADREIADREKEITARNAKGFFESIGGLVTDTFKALVTGNFDQLGEDCKRMADSPKFWDDLQKVAAVVAEVASAVVSGVTLGAGSASLVAVTAFVVGTVLSTAGMVEQNFHVVEKLTNDPEFAKYFAIGCMIGSAVCGLTSAAANGLTAAAQEGAKEALSATAKDVKTIAQTTSTVAHVVSACAQLPSAAIDYDLARTDIDAKKHAMQEQVLQRMIDDIIERVKTEHKESDKDINAARAAIATEQNTQLTAASMLRA